MCQVRGGLSGQDPTVHAKLDGHNQERQERAKLKQLRQEEALALAQRRADVLARLTGMYEAFEHLPTLTRYTNLLSTTLRSRHSPSTVDRSPKPSLAEARQYFFHPLTQFLSRMHKPHLEAFLSLTEAYGDAQAFSERQALAKQVLDRFCSPDSYERLNFDPAQVRDRGTGKFSSHSSCLSSTRQAAEQSHHPLSRLMPGRPRQLTTRLPLPPHLPPMRQVASTKAQYRAGLAANDMPADLFEPYRASVERIMEDLLPEFGRSPYYREACATGRGVLWRTVKISRLTLQLIEEVMGRVVDPFLVLCDKEGALDVVPHHSPQSRAAFRAEVLHLKASLLTLKKQLSLAGFIAKRDCKHEENQRLLKEHSRLVTSAARAGARMPSGEWTRRPLHHTQ